MFQVLDGMKLGLRVKVGSQHRPAVAGTFRMKPDSDGLVPLINCAAPDTRKHLTSKHGPTQQEQGSFISQLQKLRLTKQNS